MNDERTGGSGPVPGEDGTPDHAPWGNKYWADRSAGETPDASVARCPVCASTVVFSPSPPGWTCVRAECRASASPRKIEGAPGKSGVAVRRRENRWLGGVIAALLTLAAVSLALHGVGAAPPPQQVPPAATPSAPATEPAGPVNPSPTETQIDPPVMTGTIRVGERPVAIALDVGAGMAITANHDGGDISVIDLANGVVLYTLAVPGRPSAVATANDGVVYVADGQGRRVYGIDLTTGELVATWKVGHHPNSLAIDAELWVLYVGSDSGVTAIDLETGTILDPISATVPTDLVVDPETQLLWMLAADPATVTTYDPRTGVWAATRYGAGKATGLDLDGYRKRLYLAEGEVRELDLGSGKTRGFAVDAKASTVRVDPDGQIAYLVDPDANLVIALSVG